MLDIPLAKMSVGMERKEPEERLKEAGEKLAEALGEGGVAIYELLDKRFKGLEERQKSLEDLLRITGSIKQHNCKYINLQGYCLHSSYSSPTDKYWKDANIDVVLGPDGYYHPKPPEVMCFTCAFYETRPAPQNTG